MEEIEELMNIKKEKKKEIRNIETNIEFEKEQLKYKMIYLNQIQTKINDLQKYYAKLTKTRALCDVCHRVFTVHWNSRKNKAGEKIYYPKGIRRYNINNKKVCIACYSYYKKYGTFKRKLNNISRKQLSMEEV